MEHKAAMKAVALACRAFHRTKSLSCRTRATALAAAMGASSPDTRSPCCRVSSLAKVPVAACAYRKVAAIHKAPAKIMDAFVSIR